MVLYFLVAGLLLGAAPVLGQVPASDGHLWISTIQNPLQCSTEQIVIYGGQAPYTIDVLAGDYQTVIGNVASIQYAGEFAWCTNVAQGTSFALRLKDCTGATAYSAARVVEAGTSTCGQLLNGGPSTSCGCQQPAPQPPSECTTCGGGVGGTGATTTVAVGGAVYGPPLASTRPTYSQKADPDSRPAGCYGNVPPVPKGNGDWSNPVRRGLRRVLEARADTSYSAAETTSVHEGYFACDAAVSLSTHYALVLASICVLLFSQRW